MAISADRIRSDIEAIARCTETPGNGATRPTFSPAWGHAREYVISQALLCGAEIRTDCAGNVHARLSSYGWDQPAWLCGSHIDSVPHGGDYDGVAGVVVGLELLRSAADDGIAAAVEMIIFAEEEGPTFGLGMLGSRGWVGDLSAAELSSLKNAAGQTYIEAGEQFGVDGRRLHEDRIDPKKYLGLIEVHIEQGPGMWKRDQRLAVVRAIAGRRQIKVKIAGQANHAGATSMEDRRDALVGAAVCVTSLESLAREIGNGAVMTVGRLINHPNAINVIPDLVEFTIDFRSGDSATVEGAYLRIRALIEDVCRERELTCDVTSSESIEARPMDARLVNELNRLGGGLPITVSGALHDSAILATHLPTVMLFVPSRDGISHNPAEFSRIEDIAAAAELAEKLVRKPTITSLNGFTQEQFVATLGGVFEHSPWIAEEAWKDQPFESIADLHRAMCTIVTEANDAAKLALIRAHPDLVGKLAREGKLTRESTSEQQSAGLSDLTADEIAKFEQSNESYRAKFGFPFVICARQNRKDAILEAFPRRLANSAEQETETALKEIYKIAELRLRDAIWE